MDPHRVGPNAPNAPTRQLAALRFDRSYDDEVAMALSALDCLLLGNKGLYASSELTSGRRAQRLQREHTLPDPAALRDGLGPERYEALLWTPNVKAAVAFAERLRAQLGGSELVVSPAPFAAPGWPQEGYLRFWEELIRTRVTAVYFNDGWEYSNGCVYEFSVAVEVGLPTFDNETRPITVHQAVERVARAVQELNEGALDTRLLRLSLDRIAKQPQ